jgi:catalase
MSEKGKRSTTTGCPLADNQSVMTAEARGPTPMLEDHCSHDLRKR